MEMMTANTGNNVNATINRELCSGKLLEMHNLYFTWKETDC